MAAGSSAPSSVPTGPGTAAGGAALRTVGWVRRYADLVLIFVVCISHVKCQNPKVFVTYRASNGLVLEPYPRVFWPLWVNCCGLDRYQQELNAQSLYCHPLELGLAEAFLRIVLSLFYNSTTTTTTTTTTTCCFLSYESGWDDVE